MRLDLASQYCPYFFLYGFDFRSFFALGIFKISGLLLCKNQLFVYNNSKKSKQTCFNIIFWQPFQHWNFFVQIFFAKCFSSLTFDPVHGLRFGLVKFFLFFSILNHYWSGMSIFWEKNISKEFVKKILFQVLQVTLILHYFYFLWKVL